MYMYICDSAPTIRYDITFVYIDMVYACAVEKNGD